MAVSALLSLCLVPTASATEKGDSGALVISIDKDGATVESETGKPIDRISGDPADGETTKVISHSGIEAILAVQYSPAADASGEAGTEEGVLPEPKVEVKGENTFWSGNFGETVDRSNETEQAPEFASAVTETSASFDWLTKGDVEYRVLRDGVFVDNSTNGRFTDTGLTAGSKYNYVLETLNAGDEATASRLISITTPADSPGLSAKAIQAVDVTRTSTAFDYKTFIPDQYVSNFLSRLGCGLNAGEKFAGDNRGFTSPGRGAPYTTPSFRTQMFFNVNWTNRPPYDLVYVIGVGQTKKVSATNKVIATKRASSRAMVFQNPSRSGNLVTFGISHEAGNPFCDGGAVRYSLTWVKLYRSGTVSIEGTRQPVPSHEAYGRFVNADGYEYWKTLYTGTGPNFECLLPSVCVSENINSSVTR